MKTEVHMVRTLFGSEIEQKSKSEFLSVTDLVRAGNTIRETPFNLTLWLNNKSTKEFIFELERAFGVNPIIKGRGRSAKTWAHPLLFIDLALAIDPKLKIEGYQWLYDELLKHRNASGDSYKLMAGALYEHATDKYRFQKSMVRLANKIKVLCGVEDWQHATESQLLLRDTLHKNIALLANVLRDNDQAINIGIKETMKEINKGDAK